MPTVTMTYDQTPPSSNTNAGVGGRGNPHTVAKTKRTWEGIYGLMLMQAGVPRRLTMVKVRPKLEFRTKGRRDGDNFYMPISKPLGDVLVKGGWLEDDTPDHYQMERVKIETGVDLGRFDGRLTLEVEYSTD